MRRREFIAGLGGAATWPIVGRAQQPERMRRIGVLRGGGAADDPEGQARHAAFLQALQQLGWIDGRNVQIDTRWPAGDADDARKFAAELVALAPDVILRRARRWRRCCRRPGPCRLCSRRSSTRSAPDSSIA